LFTETSILRSPMIQKFVYRGMSRIFKSERRSLKKVGSGDEGYSKPPMPLVMSMNGKF